MNNENIKIERRGMSPWTALILGFAGIIIAAIIVGGIIANKGIEKIDGTKINIVEDIIDNPSTDEARAFVNTNWKDLINGVPKCAPAEETCPNLVIGVTKKFSEKTGRTTYQILAEVVGFGDDSNSGYGREASIKMENGNWVYKFSGDYAYTDYKLCRNMVRYPKNGVCP
jgi:hypothetical protein